MEETGRTDLRCRGALCVLLMSALGMAPRLAHAEVSISALRAAGAESFLRRAAPAQDRDRRELLVRVDSAAAARRAGLVPITSGVATFRGKAQELAFLEQATGIGPLIWAPPRALQMDRAVASITLPTAVQRFGVDGSGVVLGFVDTGIDVEHPAFRKPDGSTRVRWLLAYDQAPRGVHAALEEEFGCSYYQDCAVFDAADIDQALAGALPSELPRDRIGHGTHLAGIAAGADETFPGVAPAAELVVVQGDGGVGSVQDARIVEGVRFIFDRAAEMGAPAVANLSLGSSLGAHDGTSLLERTLSTLATGPGRIIVVAAGNDGGLYSSTSAKYPSPIGGHTEVTVPEGSEARVPLIIPDPGGTIRDALVYVWLSFSKGDRVSVALSKKEAFRTNPVAPGQTMARRSGDVRDSGNYEFVIANEVDRGLDVGLGENNAVFAVAGDWDGGSEFELVLTGSGTARLWVESFAGLGPGSGFPGVMVPRARGGGSVTIPASSPEMISVGASVNRAVWTDHTGEMVDMPLGPDGTRAFFSGSGPNQLGGLRPDLIAPGGNIASAMSQFADPRGDPASLSQFAAQGSCEVPAAECFVIDDLHGVSSGTSMAAPVVSGAVALLLQREPQLEQRQVQSLLRAGTVPLSESDSPGRSGVGMLDILDMLQAQELSISDETRLPGTKSRIALADVFLIPDPDLSLQGFVVLRDDEDRPAGGFSADRLEVRASGPADIQVQSVQGGLAEFRLVGRPSGGQQEVSVEVLFDGEVIAQSSLPVRIDAANFVAGLEIGGGTCALARPASWPRAPWGSGLVILFASALRRRWKGGGGPVPPDRRVPRGGRGPGRRGEPSRLRPSSSRR